MNHMIADPDFPLVVILAVLVLLVAVLGRIGRRHILAEATAKAREQLELRLAGFTGALAELEEQVADLTRMMARLRESVASATLPQPSRITQNNGTVATPPANASEEVSPEMLIVIAAAVTSFLGKKVRIRSAKMLQSPYEIVNPWAQQGRATIQASHNFREWSHHEPTQHRGGFRH
jgi:hypothetical protein